MSYQRRGFTLIETMVAAAVAVLFFAGSAIIVQTAIESIGKARSRGEALRLAQEKMEIVRNLPYDQIGVVGGIPAGSLPPTEHLVRNGTKYSINTSVLYIDDPFDGQAPSDIMPVDYKRVRITVTTEGSAVFKQPVLLLSDVAPDGIETIPGTGVLSVMVFNGQGIPVSNALVHIEASTLTPAISLDAISDNEGKVLLPGTPMCTGCYHLSVSKNGFTTDRTYGTNEVANPAKPHISILEGKITEASFAIDIPATVTVRVTRTKSNNYTVFSGVQMNLQGTKEIGRTIDDEPVYKINQTIVSGSGGVATINNLEWDKYTISIPSNSSVNFAGSWPFNPFSVNPGDNISYSLVVDAASPNSLLVQVLDSNQQPVDTAEAELTLGAIIATQSAGAINKGDRSQMFFRDLSPSNYYLTVKAPGFDTVSSSITVAGDRREFFMISTASATPAP